MNKQALTEALAEYTPNPGITPSDSEKRAELDRYWEQRSTILAAARLVERLLPGECENCHGDGHEHDHDWTELDMACLVCHGSGRVWDEGIVEVVARVIQARTQSDEAWPTDVSEVLAWMADARAVLNVLVEAQPFPPAGE